MYDYYDLLGVDRSADAETIEAAFRERIRELHPDRDDSGDAVEEVVQLQRARNVLTDPARRKDYDRLGHRAYVERERGAGEADVDLRSTREDQSRSESTATHSRSHTRPREDGIDSTTESFGTTRRRAEQNASDRIETEEPSGEPAHESEPEPAADPDTGTAPASDEQPAEPESTKATDPAEAIDFGEPTMGDSTGADPDGESPDDEPIDLDATTRSSAQSADDGLDAVVDIDDLVDEAGIDPDEILADDEFDDVTDTDPIEGVADVEDDATSVTDEPAGDQSEHTESPIEFGSGTDTDTADSPADTTQPGESASEPGDTDTGDSPLAEDDGPTSQQTDVGIDRSGESDQPVSDPADPTTSSRGDGQSDETPAAHSEPDQHQGDPLAGPGGGTADAGTADVPVDGETSTDTPAAPAEEPPDSDPLPPDSTEADPLGGMDDQGDEPVERPEADPLGGIEESSMGGGEADPEPTTEPDPMPGSEPESDTAGDPLGGMHDDPGDGMHDDPADGMDDDPLAGSTEDPATEGEADHPVDGAAAGGMDDAPIDEEEVDSAGTEDPLAGMEGGSATEPQEQSEYAGTDGGIERASPGTVPSGEADNAGSGGGIVATVLSVPAAIIGALIAVPAAVLRKLVSLPAAAIGAIPTFGIPAAVGESRAVLGSDWYSDEVAVMARYAWLGRLVLAAVVWPMAALALPGATLVPSASVWTLAVLAIAVLVSHVGYDLLLSIGAELEPGCHGGAAIDPPLRGLALLVVTYAAGIGLAVGAIWRTDGLSAPLLGDEPIGALPAGIVGAPEWALAAVFGVCIVVFSLTGLLSAALTLPWSDRYDRHYRVLPGLWQAPLSIAVGTLCWAALTGGTVGLSGRELGTVQLVIATGGLPIVSAIYLVRRKLETPDPQPAW